jgi:DAACS family dicarboxylate/amino acid:cation (Na+ or H+) symporter
MAGSTSSKLANRILLGLVIGIVAALVSLAIGQASPGFLASARSFSTQVLDPMGQVFLRMLFFVVIPLVFASLTTGVVQLGRLDKLGPLAGRTFTFFFLNMAVGVALGLIMMNVLRPGDHLDAESKTRLMAEFGGAAEKHVTASTTQPAMNLPTVVEMFMPKNLFGAFVGQQRNVLGDVLPLILFAILVGAVGTQLAEERRKKLQEALELVSDLMTGIVHFALQIAPYAVPAMIYSVIIKVGFDILIALGVFVLGCGGILLFHLFVSMSVFLKIWTKRSPLQFFKDIKAVLVTAFSTSSSNASLPTALSVCKETLGVAPSTAGFVIPLGTTMNMSGTALVRGLRGALCRPGVRHRPVSSPASDPAAAQCAQRGGRSRHPRRLAAADCGAPGHVWHPTGRHRHRARGGPDSRHDAHHDERRLRHRHRRYRRRTGQEGRERRRRPRRLDPAPRDDSETRSAFLYARIPPTADLRPPTSDL